MADADLSKVQSWLEQQGFSIDSVARSKNAIHFTGTVRQVEQAFSTEMHIYKVNGTQHFAPSTALSVPSGMGSTVLAIKNLDSFRPTPRLIAKKNLRGKFTGAGSTTASNQVILFAPGDIKTAYDITPLYNASFNGTGQSITLVGQSAIQVSDLENFQSNAGLAVKDPTQFLVPNSGDSTVVADGDEGESDLDLEWSNAIAPGATINFVYVGNNLNFSAFDSIQYAIDEKIGTIVSSSYGTCEVALGGETLESSFEQGTAQGQTFMAAAGDSGSTDCFGISGLTTAQQEALAVDYPASSPYVTGMGGTEISQANAAYSTVGQGYWEADSGNSDIVNSVQQYIPEAVWNDDAISSNCGLANCLSASGGGASSLFTKPSWQTGVPGIPSDGKRDVPDVALYGSPNYPGYLMCSSDSTLWAAGQQSSCSSGFEDSTTGDLTAAGGTSFDAPIFSGILALINQKQGYANGQGLVNSTLYKLASNSATYASAFHDITSGNNDCGVAADCNGTAGFKAGTGYDQVTGLGSVDANNLAAAWPASTVISSLIDTTTTITASNSAPNVGASDTFTVTVAAASGTVTPTGTVNLTVDGGTAIPETLSSNGTFVYTTSFSTAGSHVIFAQYQGGTVFAPSPASESGSVTVNVATVSSGSGSFSFTPAPTPSTLTVAQGGQGTETISIKPAGGYTGTVDLTLDAGAADGALQNLCWEWSDQNNAGDGLVPITGTASASVELTLIANGTACATDGAVLGSGKHVQHMLRRVNSTKNTGGNPLPMTLAFAGLLLVGFLGRASKRLRGLVGVLLLATVGLAVTACGGVVTTPTSNPPTGTYTITVTGQDSASSSVPTETTTFTFVIN